MAYRIQSKPEEEKIQLRYSRPWWLPWDVSKTITIHQANKTVVYKFKWVRRWKLSGDMCLYYTTNDNFVIMEKHRNGVCSVFSDPDIRVLSSYVSASNASKIRKIFDWKTVVKEL